MEQWFIPVHGRGEISVSYDGNGVMGQLIDGSECVIKAVHITEAQEAEKEAATRSGHFLQRPSSETFPPPNVSTVSQSDVIS